MTRTLKALSGAAILVACALPITAVQAQDSAAAKNRSAAFQAGQTVSLTGVTIIRVDTVNTGAAASVSALVASGSDSISAMIAPVTYLASNSLTLAAGDVIDIAGSKMTMAGKPSIIATEVKKGDTKVVLRDKTTGAPVWPAGAGMSTGMPRKP